MKVYRSLKSILMLNFVVVAVLPAVVVGTVAVEILSGNMEKEITVRNELLAKSLAAELDSFLHHPLTLLEQIRDVAEENEIVTQNELNNYLNSIVGNYGFFNAIKVLDSKGIVTHLAPLDENILGLDMSNQEYYRVTLKRNESQWSHTFLSPQDGKPTLTLTLPLRRGMLVGDLNLSTLSDVIDRVKIGKHGYAAITDNEGTAIAHRNRAFVSERLNVKNLTLIKAGMAGNEGSFRYNFRGEEKIGSVAIVPKTRWVVAVVQTTAEAFASVNRLKNIIWAGISTTILLALIVAFISMQKVLNPLSQITEDSKRIAEGDYTYTPAPHSYTEIDNLGNSFRSMIDAVKAREEALQQAHDSLELRVSERTEQLRKAKEAAETANKAKSTFLSNMSHELRTPLNAILGTGQLMTRDTQFPEKYKENLGILACSGEYLLNLINEVLEISRIEAGRGTLIKNAFNLHRMLETIEKMNRPRIAKKGLKFNIALSPGVPELIKADKAKIQQILINLLDNAVKYTEFGEIKMRVYCQASTSPVDTPEEANGSLDDGFDNKSGEQLPTDKEQRTIHFEVEDTGIGISPEHQKIIFDHFMQITDTEKYREGVGLGLTICRQYTSLMGGNISVKSQHGKGSTFTVDLPFESVDESQVLPDVLTRRVIGLEPGQPMFNILIVEDDDDSRIVLRQLLDQVGFKVEEAKNGRQAVEMHNQLQPDLIWMDIRLPVMDGMEATRRIREQELKEGEFSKHVPIIALSASAFEKDREKFLAAGCDDFLCKPFQEEEIFDKMAQYLEVRYIYQDIQTPEEKPLTPALTSADLADLPTELVQRINKAAKGAMSKQLLDLLEQIPPDLRHVADAMADLVSQYQYSKILALTEKENKDD